jgi:hypothetical protein
MRETARYSSESKTLFKDFFHRYQSLYSTDIPPDYFAAKSVDMLVLNFLQHMEEEGPNFALYHGTHSDYIDHVTPRTIYPPLYLAVNPFQSAQYALQRAWTESAHRKVTRQPSVDPVLYEIHLDLRGLSFEVFYPSPDVHVTKDIGIGITPDIENNNKHVLFEVQLVSKRAEERLKQGQVDIVASDGNVIHLLRWSQKNIGSFPLEILLPR